MVNLSNVSLINEVSLITQKDNLMHNYFIGLEWDNDNSLPVGYAYVYSLYNDKIFKYWLKYDDVVIVHAKLVEKGKENKTKQVINQLPNSSLKSKTIQKADNEYYNYSFIGRIHNVKHIGQNIQLHLENVGWKFLQKVPSKFRQSYIAGQPLGDAFQAMCELMEIEFAYSIEDLNQYKFSADGYSIEKDGTIIEEVPNLLEEWKSTKNEDENMATSLNELGNEFEGAIDKGKQNTQAIASSITPSLNAQITNSADNIASAIADNVEDDKIQKYQEEFDEKIKNLFIGNTLYHSNVTDAILNYDAITITSQSTSESNDITPVEEDNTTEAK